MPRFLAQNRGIANDARGEDADAGTKAGPGALFQDRKAFCFPVGLAMQNMDRFHIVGTDGPVHRAKIVRPRILSERG